jgi:hypothetical protein
VAACVPVDAVEPDYREIQVNLDAGGVLPSREWEQDLEAGAGVGLQAGIALTPNLSCGLYFGYNRFEAKREFLPPLTLGIGDNDWIRYSGGLFAEYALRRGRLAPFLGAYFGMHGIYIEYVRPWHGALGEGNFGFGFGLSSGLRYRHDRRFGGTLRILGENSPGMDSGWFVHARVGLCVFL